MDGPADGLHSMAEFAFLSDLGFPNPPPVPFPSTISDPAADQWMPWPWPRVGQTVPALTDETSIARADLTTIIKDIVPLRRRFLDAKLTTYYLKAAIEIQDRLNIWCNSIPPSLRSLEVLDDAPPHVFMVTYVSTVSCPSIRGKHRSRPRSGLTLRPLIEFY